MSLPRQIVLATVFVLFASAPALADGFVTPFLGYSFGGDSGNCPSLRECEVKRANFGVSFGATGAVFGFEQDISFARHFFGETPQGDNSVFTAMSNLLIGVGVGPVRPYLVGGVGLVRTRVESLTGSITNLETGGNSFGYDLGGGVTVLFGGNVGLRGDIRRFRTAQDLDLPFFEEEKLTFWRASAGLALVF